MLFWDNAHEYSRVSHTENLNFLPYSLLHIITNVRNSRFASALIFMHFNISGFDYRRHLGSSSTCLSSAFHSKENMARIWARLWDKLLTWILQEEFYIVREIGRDYTENPFLLYDGMGKWKPLAIWI